MLLAACANQQPHGRIEGVVEAHATVSAIDLPNRQVTLKSEDGEEFLLEVPPAIKNLDQVRVGDEVAFKYTQAMAWEVKPAGKGEPGMSADTTLTRAKPGGELGGTAGRTLTLTAAITRIDTSDGTVTLTTNDQLSHTVRVRDPTNLKKVQVGDLVDITYSEAVAVSVTPISKK